MMKKYKLGKIANTKSGATPRSTIASYYENGDIPWINSGELSNPYIYEPKNFITKDGFDSCSVKMFPVNTVLLAMYGATAGKASLLKVEACTNQAVCAILPNPLIVDSTYLKYKLDTMYDYLVGLSSGSARDNLSQVGISNLPLNIHSLPEQKQIAAILSALDAKIALNKSINHNLEAMAKQLYDYWFVQFDFPNAEGKPYKSSGGKMVWNEKLKREIPEGWNNCTLDYYLTIKNGRDHKHLADGDFAVYGSGGLMRRVSEYLYNGESVLVPRKGTLNNIMYVSEAFWTVDTMFYSIMKQACCAKFVYYSIKDIDFTRWDAGTGVPSMTSSTLNSIKMVKVDNNLLTRFDAIVSPWYAQIVANAKEIATLTKQRDELLPLLMNGQATVKNDL